MISCSTLVVTSLLRRSILAKDSSPIWPNACTVSSHLYQASSHFCSISRATLDGQRLTS